ncbi:MAG: PAS-domain containing protein, partial [Hyphomicrobiales bacterium]
MHTPPELILSGLDHLSVGFGIFDSEKRLVSHNRKFVELRGYPDDFVVVGTLLETLLVFNAERGDFGPGDVDGHVRERLAEIDKSDNRLVEHRMPSGQILAIRYTHLEDGGLLVAIEDRTSERQAQMAMERSEERYALISDAAEEAVYEWNISKDLFYASPRLETFLGVKSHTGGNRLWTWLELIHEGDRDKYTKVLEAHRSGEVERWSCEYRIRTADGTYRWVSDHGTSVRDSSGEAVRMVAALRDITERVESAAALRASEEWHSLVAQATSDGLYDWRLETNKLHVSDQLIKLFGFEADTLLSEDWANLIYEEDFEHYKKTLIAHLKGETPKLECEYRIRSSMGEYRWARDQGIAVRNEDGRAVRLVGAVRDITSIRAAEEELDLLQARLMDSLESLSDGFLLLDTDNRVQLWNSRYMEIFSAAAGQDMTHIVRKGRPFFEMIKDGYDVGIFMPHPEGVDGWLEGRRKAWAQPQADLRVELANGTWLMINERRMSDGGRVAIYTDIT